MKSTENFRFTQKTWKTKNEKTEFDNEYQMSYIENLAISKECPVIV